MRSAIPGEKALMTATPVDLQKGRSLAACTLVALGRGTDPEVQKPQSHRGDETRPRTVYLLSAPPAKLEFPSSAPQCDKGSGLRSDNLALSERSVSNTSPEASWTY